MDLITTPASVLRELSQKFDALPIFKRDHGTALYHLASALEMTAGPFIMDLDLVMAQGRRAFEASMRAIPAIYRNCPIAVAPSAAPSRRSAPPPTQQPRFTNKRE